MGSSGCGIVAKIRLEDNGKTIHVECVIEDQELFEILSDAEEDEERIDIFLSIVKIGAAGYRRMKVGVELDFVEKKVE